jgi:hypothetical protein
MGELVSGVFADAAVFAAGLAAALVATADDGDTNGDDDDDDDDDNDDDDDEDSTCLGKFSCFSLGGNRRPWSFLVKTCCRGRLDLFLVSPSSVTRGRVQK